MRIVFFILLAVLSASFALTETEAEKILERLRAENVNQPIHPEVARRLNGGFWKTWGWSNGGDCAEYLTPELTEARMKALKEAGYTGIVVSGRHWRLDNLACTESVVCQLKLVCDAAHRHGMFVISHFDLVQFSAGGLEFALQHPDWWTVDLQTRTVFTKFCLSNPGFRQFYIDYLKRVVRETALDGLMLDEVCFAQESIGIGSCACAVCRAGFEHDTGLPFVDGMNAIELTSLPNPWFKVYSQWRVNAVNRFQHHITTELKKDFPKLMFVTYSTAFLEPGMHLCGFSYLSHCKYMDGLGVEPPQGSTVAQAPRLITRCKLRLGVGDALEKPNWALAQTLELPDNLFFMCGFYKMFRHTIWSPRELSRLLTGWDAWPAPAHCRSQAEVALVFSEPTLLSSFDATGDGYWQNRELEGWSGALSARNITYDVLMSEAITTKILSRYPVVVLPNISVLSPKEQRALSEYLTAGGVVLASGRFGFDDTTKKSGLRPAIEVPMPDNTVFQIPSPLKNGIIAKAIFEPEPEPRFIQVGRGYLGYIPAIAVCAESWITPFEQLDCTPNRAFMDEWLKRAFAHRPATVECKTPAGLLAEVLQDERGFLLVCLLDMNGRTNAEEEIYLRKPLKGTITLKVRGVTQASSFLLQTPGKTWRPPVEYHRNEGIDTYVFSAEGLPIYTQIKVSYE